VYEASYLERQKGCIGTVEMYYPDVYFICAYNKSLIFASVPDVLNRSSNSKHLLKHKYEKQSFQHRNFISFSIHSPGFDFWPFQRFPFLF